MQCDVLVLWLGLAVCAGASGHKDHSPLHNRGVRHSSQLRHRDVRRAVVFSGSSLPLCSVQSKFYSQPFWPFAKCFSLVRNYI